MGEWTTISVRDETAERFNDVKRESAHEGGHNNYSANDFLTILLDAWEKDTGGVGDLSAYGGEVPDLSVLEADKGDIDDLREQLERIERAAKTVETRTGRIESTLEDLGR